MSFGCWLEPLSSSSRVTLNVSPDFMPIWGRALKQFFAFVLKNSWEQYQWERCRASRSC